MSIQEENARQLARLVKEQEITISKLKELVEDSYHEGYEYGSAYDYSVDTPCWGNSETRQDLEKL